MPPLSFPINKSELSAMLHCIQIFTMQVKHSIGKIILHKLSVYILLMHVLVLSLHIFGII